jgi:RHS repeat-associated protein
MAAGQLGGELYPTTSLADPARAQEINLDFGQAIQAWNEHRYKEAVEMFKTHVQKYPDSPWASEAVLHMGCDALYHGRYSEAENWFNWIIQSNSASSFPGALRLVIKARVRLANLKTAQGNFQGALEHLRIVKQASPNWRDRTYASHWIQRLSLYKHQERAMVNCGVLALADMLKQRGKKAEARQVTAMLPASARGFSLQNLRSIALKYGYYMTGLKLSVAELKEILLPAIVQLSARHRGDRGHYWVLERFAGDTLSFFEPQSNRRFQQTLKEFSQEWQGNALVFATRAKLPGTILSFREMQGFYGGCCGIPRPESNLGDPGNIGAGSCGSPVWDVNRISLNLFVTDTPMWYRPPIGPAVHLTLSYNSQSATAQYEPFGPKWQFNYGTYLVEDTGGNVTIFMPDGRRDVFVPDGYGGYAAPIQIFNTLTKIADNQFELRFPDDTVYNYNIPAGTNSLQPFLVEIVDPHGLKLTFGYNAGVELTTITDALGRTTNLTYTNGLVTKATDPFGRLATFDYDAGGNLSKITDMGGYWSSFTYDADIYLQTFSSARGTWNFLVEPSDGIDNGSIVYPPPQNTIPKPSITMWEDYRITVTDPAGNKQEHYYDGFHGDGWLVRSKDYVPYSEGKNNFVSARKTTYEYQQQPEGIYSVISRIDFPDTGKLGFYFDDSGNRTGIDDFRGGIFVFSYNAMGQMTSYQDANGAVTTLTYYLNNVDVQYVTNDLGSDSYTYNSSHDLLTYTDREGNLTTWTYNSFGQITSKQDARGRLTVYSYDSSHRLQSITRAGVLQYSFTYDGLDRVSTYTDPAGLTYVFSYNNLNEVTSVNYPDGKSVIYTYSSCCPRVIDSITDCAGRTWFYSYNKLNRLITATNPEGGVTRLDYDANGNLSEVVDPRGKVTKFKYDSNNRLVMKTYDDNSYVRYTYLPVGEAGLLASKRNARGTITYYEYDGNGNLILSFDPSDPNGTTYQYDTSNRLTSVSNSVGSYAFSYYKNDWLYTIDGPWDQDTVTYTYDPAGNPLSLAVEGGQNVSYVYDDLNRLNTLTNPAGTFTYNYAGGSSLVQSLTRPNGANVTYYYYNDPLSRLTEIANRRYDTGQMLSVYDYTYNSQDQVQSETVTGVVSTVMNRPSETNTYNNVNQFLSKTDASPKSFTYDLDGNLTRGYTPDGYQFTATYDPENRLTSFLYAYTTGVYPIIYTHQFRFNYYYIGRILVQVVSWSASAQIGDPLIFSLQSDTRFVYDAGFQRLQERDANNQVLNEYTWGLHLGGGIGGLLSLRQNGADYFYNYDGKGNVTYLLDSLSRIQGSYQYDPFGVPLAVSQSVVQPMQFSTKPYDAATGLSYYGLRFYAPVLGRWLTREPLGEGHGLNLYAFVSNNPINRLDPLGLADYDPRPTNDPNWLAHQEQVARDELKREGLLQPEPEEPSTMEKIAQHISDFFKKLGDNRPTQWVIDKTYGRYERCKQVFQSTDPYKGLDAIQCIVDGPGMDTGAFNSDAYDSVIDDVRTTTTHFNPANRSGQMDNWRQLGK